MTDIVSYEQYRALVKRAKEQGFTQSNCFFLPAAVRQRIEEGKLSYKPINHGALILEDEGSFYRCYFFLPPGREPAPVCLDKPGVIECVFSGGLDASPGIQASLIEGMGFVLGRRSVKMTALPEKGKLASCFPAGIAFAEPGDAPIVMDLLRETFDERYSFIPSLEGLLQAVNEHRVHVVKKDGSIVALLHYSQTGKVLSLDHLLVKELYRGQGLATSLISTYHSLHVQEAAAFVLWVDIENVGAVTLYERSGYSILPKRANEYII